MKCLSKFVPIFAAAVFMAGAAQAQSDWPQQPVKLIVPLSPGGGVDTMARLIAKGLTDELGQRVVVENQTGAGGTIASGTVASADPDGYTLIFQSVSSAVVNPLAYNDLPYDPVKGFDPVTLATQFPLVLVTNPNVPAKSLPEFIKLLKENPGKYTYGSSGVGTITHLAAELFLTKSETGMVHVPYRGNAPANTDLLAGRIDLIFDGVAPQMGNIEAGSVTPLAVTTTERSKALPEVPTVAEELSGYNVPYWTAIFAPAGTPQEVLDKVAAATKAVVNNPETAKRLEELGVDGIGSTPGELGSFWQEQLAYFGQVIEDADIQMGN